MGGAAHLLWSAGRDVGHALEALVDVVVDQLLELWVAPGAPALLPPLAPRHDVVPEEQRQQVCQIAVRAQHRLSTYPHARLSFCLVQLGVL